METRKNTTAGVLVWTPAPACTSPTSSVISEDVWEDEDGEHVEKEDDFFNQMDDNGIIGLSEALENVEMGKTCGDADADCNPGWYPTLPTPEKADPSGHKKDTPSEKLSYSLDTEFPGEDVQILSPCDIMGSLKSEAEHVKRSKEEEDGDKQGMNSGSRRTKNKHMSISGERGATNGITESYINKGENKKILWGVRTTQSCGPHTVSNHHCPLSESATAVTAPTLPHLLHFSAEEIAAAPGIEAETLPEVAFTESLPESLSSKMSLKSSPRCLPKSERLEQKSLQAAATFPEQVRVRSHSKSTSDRDPKTTGARTKAAEINESRKDLLHYRTPDFSKVEPRVRFPKSGYRPPKSKLSFKKESLSPGPPILFKSPADIVKEVLMNTTDGPPAPTSAPSSTVPEDFRSRQQATALLEQLQEGYNRLLTKYAEAENTIDRLRLEAKVNLYSDPPKPSHSVQSGSFHTMSKFMALDLPQAQRAEKSATHLNGHSCHQSLQVGEQLDKVLYSQANKFLQQLQTYGDNLKRERLKPFEQIKGLSQLAEGLDSLESGYLLARDEHRRLQQQQQQQGTKISKFDPERELEGLIYQCGLCMDELKEQVEEMQQEQPVCEASPSPPPQPILSSVPSDGGEVLTRPQTPPVPLLIDPGRAAEGDVSSASEENNEKESETEDEETLKDFYLKPLTGKHRYVEQDFATLMDDYQSFSGLPKIVEHSLKEGSLQSADLGTNMQPGNERQDRHSQGRGNMEVQESLPKRKVKLDDQDLAPLHTSKQQTSRFSPSSGRASTQSTTLRVHPPGSCRRIAVGKSHSSSLSSLGESTAWEQKNSKLQTGSRRVFSQDGIISPETDSGFVGSESSNLNPAADPSAVHQRGSESLSGCQEGGVAKPQTGPFSAPSFASSPSHGHMDTEPRGASHLISDQPRKSRQGQRRRTFSCSPQRWVSQTNESRATSGTSGLESDATHSLPEDRQSDQYPESVNSVQSSYPCSSPTVRYHHGDPLRALGLDQVVNRNHAMQSLQEEVSTLKERLESLRNKNSSAQDKYTAHYTSTPHIRLGDRPLSDVSRGRRERQMDVEAEELRRTTRTRSASSHRQKSQTEISTGSERGLSTFQPQPQMSRCTHTCATAPDTCCSPTNGVHSRRTHPRQHHALSIQVSETGDEPDRSCQAPLCSQCSSHHRGQAQSLSGPICSNRKLDHSSYQCPWCGHPNLSRSSKSDCRRDSDPPQHTTCHPAESPDRVVKNTYVAAAAPPTLLQYLPVCPPQFLVYSLPVHMPPRNSTGTSSAVRSRGDVRTRCSLSANKQHSFDSSLSKAIRAAQHMKHTSRRMARSLASGLQYQELLTQSCNY